MTIERQEVTKQLSYETTRSRTKFPDRKEAQEAQDVEDLEAFIGLTNATPAVTAIVDKIVRHIIDNRAEVIEFLEALGNAQGLTPEDIGRKRVIDLGGSVLDMKGMGEAFSKSVEFTPEVMLDPALSVVMPDGVAFIPDNIHFMSRALSDNYDHYVVEMKSGKPRLTHDFGVRGDQNRRTMDDVYTHYIKRCKEERKDD